MIVGYVFFAIMTSGLCLASSLGTVFGIERFRPFEKRHAILAVLRLTTAFLIIALDLHYPVRMVFGAVLVPSPTSPDVVDGRVLRRLPRRAPGRGLEHVHRPSDGSTSGPAPWPPASRSWRPCTLGAVFGVIAAKPFWHGLVHADH